METTATPCTTAKDRRTPTRLPKVVDSTLEFLRKDVVNRKREGRSARSFPHSLVGLCEKCAYLEWQGHHVHLATSKKFRRFDDTPPDAPWTMEKIAHFVRYTRVVIEGGRHARKEG